MKQGFRGSTMISERRGFLKWLKHGAGNIKVAFSFLHQSQYTGVAF
jgi:hypothetical protein